MEYAAAADAGQRERTFKGQKYPWSGGYTRSEKKTIKSDQLC
jgi:hypothetical protein